MTPIESSIVEYKSPEQRKAEEIRFRMWHQILVLLEQQWESMSDDVKQALKRTLSIRRERSNFADDVRELRMIKRDG